MDSHPPTCRGKRAVGLSKCLGVSNWVSEKRCLVLKKTSLATRPTPRVCSPDPFVCMTLYCALLRYFHVLLHGHGQHKTSQLALCISCMYLALKAASNEARCAKSFFHLCNHVITFLCMSSFLFPCANSVSLIGGVAWRTCWIKCRFV